MQTRLQLIVSRIFAGRAPRDYACVLIVYGRIRKLRAVFRAQLCSIVSPSSSPSLPLRMDEADDFVESEAEESGEESGADSSDESEGEGGERDSMAPAAILVEYNKL